VRAELFSGHPVPGPLGTFQIDAAGDTSIHRYGVYRLSGGRLKIWQELTG
jgi:hypothetical protein